jgi:hypothetical protein
MFWLLDTQEVFGLIDRLNFPYNLMSNSVSMAIGMGSAMLLQHGAKAARI